MISLGSSIRIMLLFALCLTPIFIEACASQVYLGKDKDGKNLYGYSCKGAPCQDYEGSYLQWGPKTGTQSSCGKTPP